MLLMRFAHRGIHRLERFRYVLTNIQILNAMSRSDPTRGYAYRHAHPEIYLQL